MDKPFKPARIILILLVFAAVAVFYVIHLYDLQMVSSREYVDTSAELSTETYTVSASRGSILDRNGNVLVSSVPHYDIVIDRLTLITSQDPNGTLLFLINAADKCGFPHADTMPIRDDSFVEMTDSQKRYLGIYLEFFNLPEDISAPELMAFFRSHYGIPESYTDAEARLAAGVRYELEIRVLTYVPDYKFCRDISRDLLQIVSENKLPGVSISTTYERVYHTKYAAQLLGYVRSMDSEDVEYYTSLGYPLDASVGHEGVEEAFESYLHGKDGTLKITRDSSGAVVAQEYTAEPEPGGNVVLSIDIGMQAAAEEALADGIAELNASRGYGKLKATGGAVVVLDLKSNEVLASASNPTYEPAKLLENYSELASDPASPLYKRALQGTYSRGSTFKPVVAAGALQEGIISIYTPIHTTGVYEEYKDYPLKCWIYPGSHGDINVIEALEVSCNFFFCTIGNSLGIDRLSAYAAMFGLGEATGIEIAEETGVLATRKYKQEHSDEPWYGGDTIQASIGQSYNLFTPMQLAVYTSAIANSGTRYRATLLNSVKSYDNTEILYSHSPEIASSVTVEQEYFDAIHRGMLAVAQSGSAADVFKDFPISVAAKTGTVQLGDNAENNGVFICYAPYDEPQIAVAVVVERGGSGSAVASIARSVLEYYFDNQNSSDAVSAENTLLS